ncbi:MAG: hypothetical protein JWO42_3913 [Chloroflexi bacterium]|jgi:hypothetical protein|nr:hypothetical protein [Chloroflexota bacterium]
MANENEPRAAWEERDLVRRTIMLPAEVERELAEIAVLQQTSTGELIRELIVSGLARLAESADSPTPDGATPGE